MEKPAAAQPFHLWAERPPMGWNSWDCFATTVTEEQVRAQAAFMAEKLKAFGWEYVVVDIQWYEPGADGYAYRAGAEPCLDGFGRLLPAPNKFPSAAEGKGFKPLADHIHGLGLKFGLHLMRGVPRSAAERGTPLLGTAASAADIADRVHTCPWNPDMFGVDMSKPGAQEYYDSVFALLASWGTDYVKVDDISRPYFQNLPEIEAVRKAIDRCGRPMVLSLSPGATDIGAATHVAAHANLWRVSDDFWDRWLALKEQFRLLELWNDKRRPGAWPDADMLPLGVLAMGKRSTRFTRDEQTAMMSLWCIARSPLMHGGDLTKTDGFTLSLLTNDEVLALNRSSSGNRPLPERDGIAAWTAEDPQSGDAYLALFNLRDRFELGEAASLHAPALVASSEPRELEIDVEVAGGASLFLQARPESEAGGFIPVAWTSPRLLLRDGSELSLSELPWKNADSPWDGARMEAAGREGLPELRALAPARIEFSLPEGALRFRASFRAEALGGEAASAIVWTVAPRSGDEDRRGGAMARIELSELGIEGDAEVRDLWARRDLGRARGAVSAEVPFHGARLFRLKRL